MSILADWNQVWQSANGLRSYLKTRDLTVKSIGKASTGHDLWFVKVGRNTSRPIMITAGSHADEVAGVWAAIRLIEELSTDCAVYVIPLRDPLGWDGYTAALQQVGVGIENIDDHDSVARTLRQGTLVWHSGEASLTKLGSLAFGLVEGADWPSTRLVRHILPEVIEGNSLVREELSGKFVIVPGNTGNDANRSPFGWGGHTAYVSSAGFAGHLNRFFDRNDGPAEVTLLRSFVNHIRPGLTIDLHEGFGEKFYAFSPEDDASVAVSNALITAVKSIGAQVALKQELAPTWGPKVTREIAELGEGVFGLSELRGTRHASFAGYCSQFGPAVTTESGMLADRPLRTDWIVEGVKGAVRAWERMEVR